MVERLANQVQVPISIDTYKAETARRCLDAGAAIVNDITALHDPEMARVVAVSGAGVVAHAHARNAANDADRSHYDDVFAEVRQVLPGAVARISE